MNRHALMIAAVVLSTCSLQAQSEEFGKWVSLFNGKDTSGWVIAKPKAGEEPPPCRWTVEDGAMARGSDRRDICTEALFENYELEIEHRSEAKADGNSGVYLCGKIEIQVNKNYEGGKRKERLDVHDSGSIYGKFAPLANPQNPPGEWNKFRILHLGNRITVWSNGVLIQDNVYVDGPTGGPMGDEHPRSKEKIAITRGPIMLQGDHGNVWYRNIRIRELYKASDGWRPLWNGKDLSELTVGGGNVAEYWTIDPAARALTNTRWGGGGGHDAWTQEKFGNFLVHYAFKSDPAVEGGNSGFYLRDQWEIQILNPPGKGEIPGEHGIGALYSTRKPSVVAYHGPGQWNHMDVKLLGNKVWVWQNGKLIHEGVALEKRTDNGEKTAEFSKAAFKLQGDHGRVWFSDLRIKPLPDGAR